MKIMLYKLNHLTYSHIRQEEKGTREQASRSATGKTGADKIATLKGSKQAASRWRKTGSQAATRRKRLRLETGALPQGMTLEES